MELRVEALPGCNLPTGCFVGVRVGEVLKQGRYDPGCCYRFPALERQRNAKIDLYQHIGTCNAIVDPDTKGNNEVKVSGSDGKNDLRLKVSTRPEASKPREERKTEVKKQAKDFLGRHLVEERLCNAVKALLSAQPEDPTEFLVAHLRESCPKAAATKLTYSTPFPAPMLPFAGYYTSHALKIVPAKTWQKTYAMFPAAERKVETLRRAPPPAPAAAAPAARETEPATPLPAEESKAREAASPPPPEAAAAAPAAAAAAAAAPAKSGSAASSMLEANAANFQAQMLRQRARLSLVDATERLKQQARRNLVDASASGVLNKALASG